MENIEGLYYIPNYLSQKEIDDINTFLNTTTKWSGVSPNINSRRVIHFGYNYSYNHLGITKTDDIPDNLKLIDNDKVNNLIKKNLLTEKFEQLIINEYKPAQGIASHIDHIKYFGPVIACISVGDISIDFSKKFVKHSIHIESGSLYIMSGPARYEWYHAIEKKLYDGDKKRETRYSLTYRTIDL